MFVSVIPTLFSLEATKSFSVAASSASKLVETEMNFIVRGPSGSGKSAFIRTAITQALDEAQPVCFVLLTYETEYACLAEAGELPKIYPSSAFDVPRAVGPIIQVVLDIPHKYSNCGELHGAYLEQLASNLRTICCGNASKGVRTVIVLDDVALLFNHRDGAVRFVHRLATILSAIDASVWVAVQSDLEREFYHLDLLQFDAEIVLTHEIATNSENEGLILE